MDSLNFGAKSYQLTCPEFPLECDLKGSYAVKLTTVQLPSRCRLVL